MTVFMVTMAISFCAGVGSDKVWISLSSGQFVRYAAPTKDGASGPVTIGLPDDWVLFDCAKARESLNKSEKQCK